MFLKFTENMHGRPSGPLFVRQPDSQEMQLDLRVAVDSMTAVQTHSDGEVIGFHMFLSHPHISMDWFKGQSRENP